MLFFGLTPWLQPELPLERLSICCHVKQLLWYQYFTPPLFYSNREDVRDVMQSNKSSRAGCLRWERNHWVGVLGERLLLPENRWKGRLVLHQRAIENGKPVVASLELNELLVSAVSMFQEWKVQIRVWIKHNVQSLCKAKNALNEEPEGQQKRHNEDYAGYMGVGRIFQRGPLGNFSTFFVGGWAKVVKFFFYLETKKTTFFAEIFKIQGGKAPPALLSHAHGRVHFFASRTVQPPLMYGWHAQLKLCSLVIYGYRFGYLWSCGLMWSFRMILSIKMDFHGHLVSRTPILCII